MENITPEMEQNIVKAATAGFAQSLINRGYSEEAVKQACTEYVQSSLQKRAHNRAVVAQAVGNMLTALRSQA